MSSTAPLPFARSLRGKLLLPLFLIGGIVAAMTVWGLQQRSTRQLRSNLQQRAELIAHMVNYAARTITDAGNLQQLVAALVAEPEVLEIIVVGGSPTLVLASTTFSLRGKPLSAMAGEYEADDLLQAIQTKASHQHFHAARHTLDFISPILFTEPEMNGQLLSAGSIRVRLDTRPMEASIQQSTLRLSAGVFAGFATLAALGYGQLRRIVVRPISAIGKALAQGREASDEAWAAATTDDEIGVLTLALRQSLTQASVALLELENQNTKNKQAEAALRESELRWKFAVEGSGDGLWDWDIVASTVFFSTQWKAMLGFSEDDISNTLVEWSKRLHPDDLSQVMAEVEEHFKGTTSFYISEHRLSCKDGSWKWHLARGMVISRDAFGKPLRMIGVSSDITERKLGEESIRSSLLEKEALLQEVHHRVKNNLQLINSLLRLESGRTAVSGTKEVLADMQGRIRSMALLHESLYQSGTFAAVDLGAYVRQIATQSFRAFAVSPGVVQLHLDIASVRVVMDQAVPCGLLANELISNCLKHGFPEGRGGEVRIELGPLNGGPQIRLCVSDTGVGLPADFEAKRSDSLGLQLVVDLVEQLEGTLEIGPVPAAVFTVTFTPAEVKPRSKHE
ncbi:MAG: PAS domain S-box protein [Pedosphaera sp.]|nr:PAS domain S-box protein [Pedosphaera sp.]